MNTIHSDKTRQVHERLLAASSARSRFIEVDAGQQIHIVETSDGPPLLLFHGTGNSALFLLPLLEHLEGIGAVAVDRPGVGLSDPGDLPRARYREAAVSWIDRLLNALELNSVSLLGNSAGGLWALWYALARPDHVRCLVFVGGAPLLPETRSPLPFRLIATPILGELLQRQESGPQEILQFARFMGEENTLANLPDLVDLLVAADQDAVSAKTRLDETRSLLSPFALISLSGWRNRMRVRPAELRQLAVPTLLIWGEREPLGGVKVAQRLTDLIPDARLEVLPTGHGPWLGYPEKTAKLTSDFVLTG